jgi:hypothetical protein
MHRPWAQFFDASKESSEAQVNPIIDVVGIKDRAQ